MIARTFSLLGHWHFLLSAALEPDSNAGIFRVIERSGGFRW
jgi:hypothetical protein